MHVAAAQMSVFWNPRDSVKTQMGTSRALPLCLLPCAWLPRDVGLSSSSAFSPFSRKKDGMFSLTPTGNDRKEHPQGKRKKGKTGERGGRALRDWRTSQIQFGNISESFRNLFHKFFEFFLCFHFSELMIKGEITLFRLKLQVATCKLYNEWMSLCGKGELRFFLFCTSFREQDQGWKIHF